MAVSGTTFTGGSQYANDFQSVISRAVAIASLPLSQLSNQKADMIGESTALTSLDSKVAALQNAITSIQTSTGTSSYASSVSDPKVATTSLGTGISEGTYTLVVSDLGASSTALSSGTPAVSDPAKQNLTTDESVTLTVGTKNATFAPGKSLNDLAAAINSSGLNVKATVVNVGTDFRLSLAATKLGDNDITLTKSSNGANLLGAATRGHAASYSVNGLETTTGDSTTVSVAPGLTVNMLTEGTATITVSRDRTSISNALQSFATAYNTAVGELDTHRGNGVGALKGNPLISGIATTLRNVVFYDSGGGNIRSLTDIGLAFDKEGKLSFNQSSFNLSTFDKVDDLVSFLNDSTSGFIKGAGDMIDGLEKSTGGAVKVAITTLQEQMTLQDKRISTEQQRIEDLQLRLQDQFAKSDALIASLEQQASYYTNLFAAMQTAAKSMA